MVGDDVYEGQVVLVPTPQCSWYSVIPTRGTAESSPDDPMLPLDCHLDTSSVPTLPSLFKQDSNMTLEADGRQGFLAWLPMPVQPRDLGFCPARRTGGVDVSHQFRRPAPHMAVSITRRDSLPWMERRQLGLSCSRSGFRASIKGFLAPSVYQ
jgi:hypothetical protein